MSELTVVVGTRNNIEWVDVYLHSLYSTAHNKDIKVIITDQSTPENYEWLQRECNSYPGKIHLVHHSEPIHHITELLRAVELVDTRYCLFTHIDAIFLYDNWDNVLLNKIEKHPVFAAGYKNELYSRVLKDGIYIKTEFVFAEPKLILDSKFDHFYFTRNSDGVFIDIEHGFLTIEMMKRGQGYLILCRQIDRYGSIYHYEGQEFLYHCSYSSRLRPDNPNPIPPDEFISGGIGQMFVNKQPPLLKKWFLEYRQHGVTLEKFINNEFQLLSDL